MSCQTIRRLRVTIVCGVFALSSSATTVWSSLPDGASCSLTGTSPFTEVGSYLLTTNGAAGAVADFDRNGKTDLLLASYSLSLGSVSGDFVYTIGWDVDWGTATAARWDMPLHFVSGVADPGRCDVGAAIADINANGTPDLVIGTYASVAGTKKFAYRIAWDLDSAGKPASTSTLQEADGFDQTFVCNGTGIAIADLDASGRPDLILSVYIGPDGERGSGSGSSGTSTRRAPPPSRRRPATSPDWDRRPAARTSSLPTWTSTAIPI